MDRKGLDPEKVISFIRDCADVMMKTGNFDAAMAILAIATTIEIGKQALYFDTETKKGG